MRTMYFNDEHEVFRKNVRKFIAKEIRPHAEEWEENGHCPREIFKKCGDMGYLGLAYSEEDGGAGVDYFYNVVFAEEIAKCGALGLSLALLVHSQMASPALSYVGTREQKEKYLKPIIAGEKIAALGVTEANHGSDVASIQTRAVKDGDYYVINGSKTFITNGPMADIVTLAARTGVEGYKGVSLFVFETSTPGFSVGKKMHKLGMRTSETSELFFDDCRVPAANLLGKEGDGFKGIMMGFENERIIGATHCFSGAELALDLALKYAGERSQFGKPIGEFQAIYHMLAEMATEVEAARQLTYYAAWLHSQKIRCIKEVSMAKYYASEVCNQVANKALQIHGGYGYIREYEIERVFRDLRLTTIGAGTTQIQKNIIAKELGVGENGVL